MQTTREVLGALSSSGAANEQASELTLAALVEQYMGEYTGRDRLIASRLERWVALLGDRAVSSLSDDDVFHALERIGNAPAELFSGYDVHDRPVFRSRGRKRSGATANRYRNALAGMFRWAIAKRRVPRGFVSPCKGIPKQPEPPGRTRFLTPDERERLLSACKASRWERLYAVVLIAITTGARRGEISMLTWADVSLEERRAYLRHTKNGSQRVLPLTGAVVAALRPFYEADAKRFKPLGAKLVFRSDLRPDQPRYFELVWQEALAAAGITGFKFHDCRHTAASYLAQHGASLLELADFLGHRQLEMVRRYAHLTVDSKERLVARVLGGIE